jgi:hypothetical protein
MIVIHAVHSLLMGILQGKVGRRRAERPDLDSVIKTSRCEDLRIFRVL